MRSLKIAILCLALAAPVTALAQSQEGASLSDLKAQLREINNSLAIARDGGLLVDFPGRARPVGMTRREFVSMMVEWMMIEGVDPKNVALITKYITSHRERRRMVLESQAFELAEEISRRTRTLAAVSPPVAQLEGQILQILADGGMFDGMATPEQMIAGAQLVEARAKRAAEQARNDAFNRGVAIGRGIGNVFTGASGGGQAANTGPAARATSVQPAPPPPAQRAGAGAAPRWSGRYSMGLGGTAEIVGSGTVLSARWVSDLEKGEVRNCTPVGNQARCAATGTYETADVTVRFSSTLDLVINGDTITGKQTYTAVTPQWRVPPFQLAHQPGRSFELQMKRIN